MAHGGVAIRVCDGAHNRGRILQYSGKRFRGGGSLVEHAPSLLLFRAGNLVQAFEREACSPGLLDSDSSSRHEGDIIRPQLLNFCVRNRYARGDQLEKGENVVLMLLHSLREIICSGSDGQFGRSHLCGGGMRSIWRGRLCNDLGKRFRGRFQDSLCRGV